jgi:riboflavin kinase / FMN adenylyltransferase
VSSQRAFGAPLGPGQATLVAIGNFDGVHRGHQAVLAQALAAARSEGVMPIVLTFDPHPAVVLGRGSMPALTSFERKLELLCRQGPELGVVIEEFTPALAKTEPADFVAQLLVQKLGARLVLVGEDFRFGRGRAGDFALLEQLGRQHGFRALAATLERDARGPISSTRIRGALADGDLNEVTRLLGRPHALSGVVVQGQGRGRTIGVPTANLGDMAEALPPHGVYAVLVDQKREEASGTAYRALGGGVANFGVRPTLNAGPSFEVHLLDFDQDLYGQSLRVHLVSRLREERKFAGIDELRAQIGRDIEAGRTIVAACKPDPSARGAWY